MTYFWHKQEYHEKYHVQKLLLILTGNIEKQSHAVLQASHIMIPVAPKNFFFAHATTAIAERRHHVLAVA